MRKIMSAIESRPLVLECPGCKVSLLPEHIPNSGFRRVVCPFCGLIFALNNDNNDSNERRQSQLATMRRRARRRRRRSVSPNLPAVSPETEQLVSRRPPTDTSLGQLLSSSLGSLTLGNFSLFRSTDKLPVIESPKMATEPSFLTSAKFDLFEPLGKTEFEQMVSEVDSNREQLHEFFANTFSSHKNIIRTFGINKKKSENNELNLDLVYLESVWFNLIQLSHLALNKALLRAIVQCLLDNDKEKEQENRKEMDKAKAMLILLQLPLFASHTTYPILAHLLQQITRLGPEMHQKWVLWVRQLQPQRLRAVIRNLLQFMTVRQFPPSEQSLPDLRKTRWWIPTATKVLALLNAANNLGEALVDYTDFYNSSLDHMDLMNEYYVWQNPEKPNQFSYCQYPFVLSIVAKQQILTKDSEQQMILTARRSLVHKMARQQQPQIKIFFLNINVRRDNLLGDSMKEISEKQRDLKKKLKISFVNEPGLDMGGLTKEWFQLLVRQIFDADSHLFVYHRQSRCFWFALSHLEDEEKRKRVLKEYNLIGVLMGLAVYNSIILDVHLPSVAYRKLLSPPVVPVDDKDVGLIKQAGLEELRQIVPDVADSLDQLTKYEGDVEQDLMLTFQATLDEGSDDTSKLIDHELIPNGSNIPVTATNRKEFVELYIDWILNKGVQESFRAFYLGFHSVCASNALILLRPEEVEQLVCGSPRGLDVQELRKSAYYEGYKNNDITIQHFWQVVSDYSSDLQRKLLRFTTGSDRLPVGGTADLSLKISRLRDKLHHLPVAHTCFNQLVLPDYRDKERLKRKLTIAIANAEGFGIE